MKNNANLAQARIDRAIKEEGDYYATSPSMVLEDYLSEVESSDLFDRWFGHTGFNFLERPELFGGSIITNPPYSLDDEFVKKAI